MIREVGKKEKEGKRRKKKEERRIKKEEERTLLLVAYDSLQELPHVIPTNSREGRSLQDGYKTV